MDFLWSPWRYRYVTTSGQGIKTDCIFCAKSQADDDENNFIIYRGVHNFLILNAFPYSSGHLMIAPYQHVASLEDAGEEAVIEMMLLARITERKLREVYQAPGINIGMNLGRAAGAGIADHIHLHELPRWPGDVNFMTSIAETRVLPEDLRTSYERLRDAFRGQNNVISDKQ
jgi:ATP adenylyltransferase